MMIDFSELNGKLKVASKPASSEILRSLVEAADARVSAVNNCAEAYARTYVMVQELSVNSEGNVVDQTDDSRKSIALNNLRATQLRLKQSVERMDALVDELDQLQPVNGSIKTKFTLPKSIRNWDMPHIAQDSPVIEMGGPAIGSNGTKTKVQVPIHDIYTATRAFAIDASIDKERDFGSDSCSGTNFNLAISVHTGDASTSATINFTIQAGYIRSPVANGHTLGSNFFTLGFATARGSLQGDPVGMTTNVPFDAFRADIRDLLTLNFGVIGSKVSSGLDSQAIGAIGWYLTVKDGVTEEDIAQVSGASEFVSQKCNKVFNGIFFKTIQPMTIQDARAKEAEWPKWCQGSVAISTTSLTEESRDQSINAKQFFTDIANWTKSPVLQAILPNYQKRYGGLGGSAETPTRYQRGLIDSRAQFLLFYPDSAGNFPDSVLGMICSPWTCFILGSARIWKHDLQVNNLYKYLFTSDKGDYLVDIVHELLMRSLPADVQMEFTDSTKAPSLVPALNGDDQSSEVVEVDGSIQLGSDVAKSLLLSNQGDVESVIMSL